MIENFRTLKKCPLFADIEETEIAVALDCMNAKEVRTKKNEIIFAAGDRPENVGIVLDGSVHIVQEDYWGNRIILAAITAGGIFGEAFSCAEASFLPVSVLAHDSGAILLIDSRKIMTPCSSACLFHLRLISNLIKVLANKNIALTRKMEHITKKTTKDRVLSYLSECALAEGTNSFTIPFNRQELADYLSVERSALSSTLSKMRDERIIWFEKNKFRIL